MNLKPTKTAEPTGAESLSAHDAEHNHARVVVPAAKAYPAITIPVAITAEEHARIAGFCEDHRIMVAEFITLRGVGFDMKDYSDDAINRAHLVGEVAERFGGSWPVQPNPETPSVTVEFSAEAFAMLEFMRRHDGFDSAEAWIRHSVAGSVLSVFEFITHEKEGKDNLLAEFGVLAEEEESLAVAANRDGLPLAAAAKPSRPKK